jgi:hypothetical protein
VRACQAEAERSAAAGRAEAEQAVAAAKALQLAARREHESTAAAAEAAHRRAVQSEAALADAARQRSQIEGQQAVLQQREEATAARLLECCQRLQVMEGMVATATESAAQLTQQQRTDDQGSGRADSAAREEAEGEPQLRPEREHDVPTASASEEALQSELATEQRRAEQLRAMLQVRPS